MTHTKNDARDRLQRITEDLYDPDAQRARRRELLRQNALPDPFEQLTNGLAVLEQAALELGFDASVVELYTMRLEHNPEAGLYALVLESHPAEVQREHHELVVSVSDAGDVVLEALHCEWDAFLGGQAAGQRAMESKLLQLVETIAHILGSRRVLVVPEMAQQFIAVWPLPKGWTRPVRGQPLVLELKRGSFGMTS